MCESALTGLRVSHARHTPPSGTDPVGLHPRMFSIFWLVVHRRRTVSLALNNEWNALWWRLCFKPGFSPFPNISRFSSYANFSLSLNTFLNATYILKYRIESLHTSRCSVAAAVCGDTIKVAVLSPDGSAQHASVTYVRKPTTTTTTT